MKKKHHRHKYGPWMLDWGWEYRGCYAEGCFKEQSRKARKDASVQGGVK